MEISVGFHDGVIKEINKHNDFLEIAIACWDGITILRCHGKVQYNLDNLNCILSSNMKITPKGLLWTCDDGLKNDWTEISGDNENWQIEAEIIEWKFIIKYPTQ